MTKTRTIETVERERERGILYSKRTLYIYNTSKSIERKEGRNTFIKDEIKTG